MENRGTLCFLVGTLSGQPHPRRQSTEARHATCGQPRCHGTADGCCYLDAQPHLPRGTISAITHQARCPESYYRDGPPTRSTRVPNVEVRSTLQFAAKLESRSILGWLYPRNSNRPRASPETSSRVYGCNLETQFHSFLSEKLDLLLPVSLFVVLGTFVNVAM
jgi:hypothetical protein